MSNEIIKHGGGDWSEEQKTIVRNSLANGASDSEFAVLWEMARSRGLNPIKKEIYFVKRWDSQKKAEVWATQVSIDGLRVIAARSGEYDGQDEPEFEYDEKGKLKLCKVKVYRKGIARPIVGIAHWAEFAQFTRDGNLTSMWAQKGHVMLSKAAEAQALRKAFPDEVSGLYVPEETIVREQAPAVVVTPLPAAPPPQNVYVATGEPVIDAQVVGASEASPLPEYQPFLDELAAVEWKKQIKPLKAKVADYYKAAGKIVPPELIAQFTAREKELP